MYLENLFVCRKNYKNGQMTCIGGNGTWQGAMGAHATLADAMWHHSKAPPPCHVTNPWDGLLTPSPALIHGALIQRYMLSCLESMGLLSYTWRGPNRPPNCLTSWETDLPAMQPPSRGHPSPLDGEAVQWKVGRPWPMSADAPPPLHHLIFAYMYPPAL